MKKILICCFVVLLSGCTVFERKLPPVQVLEISDEAYVGSSRYFTTVSNEHIGERKIYSIKDETDLAILVFTMNENNVFRVDFVSENELDYNHLYVKLKAIIPYDFKMEYGRMDYKENNQIVYQSYYVQIDAENEDYLLSKEYIQNIIASLDLENDTTEEKIKKVHDYIILTTAYDETVLSMDVNSITSHPSFQPYGVFENKKAVCTGYAKAFYIIMKELKIPCIFVSSEVINHAWNAVYIEDWMWIDLTWNDPIPDELGRVLYTYYLKNIVEFTQDGKHIFDQINSTGLSAEEFIQFAKDIFY